MLSWNTWAGASAGSDVPISAASGHSEKHHLFDFSLVPWHDLTLKDMQMSPEEDQSPTSGQVKNTAGKVWECLWTSGYLHAVRLLLDCCLYFGTRAQLLVRQLYGATWCAAHKVSITGRYKQSPWYADGLLCLFACVLLSDWWVKQRYHGALRVTMQEVQHLSGLRPGSRRCGFQSSTFIYFHLLCIIFTVFFGLLLFATEEDDTTSHFDGSYRHCCFSGGSWPFTVTKTNNNKTDDP